MNAGFNLTMAHTAPGGSTIYYTFDGTDPRLVGGAISGTAQTYSTGIPLNNALILKQFESKCRPTDLPFRWSQLDLTRFRGHLIRWEKGVHGTGSSPMAL